MEHGRPTDFKEEYIEQAYKLCLLGATDKTLADFFEVCEATINNWKIKHPTFLESIKRGKLVADSEVASSLYKRATGYKVQEVHKQRVEAQAFDLEVGAEGLGAVPSDEDMVLTKVIVKEMPPDTTAGIFWLKNRNKENWRDKIDVENSGTLGLGVTVTKEEAKDISDSLESEV